MYALLRRIERAGHAQVQRTQLTAKGTLVSVDEEKLSMQVELDTGAVETFWLGQGDPLRRRRSRDSAK